MSSLTVDLYQSAFNPPKFLAVRADPDPAGLPAPMVFDQDYGEVVRYQSAFEFDPEQTYAGVDAAKIAADIPTVKWSLYRRID